MTGLGCKWGRICPELGRNILGKPKPTNGPRGGSSAQELHERKAAEIGQDTDSKDLFVHFQYLPTPLSAVLHLLRVGKSRVALLEF